MPAKVSRHFFQQRFHNGNGTMNDTNQDDIINMRIEQPCVTVQWILAERGLF
jgi:hypothetical protein